MFGLAKHEKFTYEHYLLLPEGDRRELIEGELLVIPAPTTKHQRICRNIGFEFHQFVERENLGEVFFAPFDVILDEYNVVQPDIVVVLNEHSDRIHIEGLRGAPDIVVEILSPATSSRDRIYKKLQYFRFGVREYWIVDRGHDTVEHYTRGVEAFDGGFVEEIVSGILPGFTLELSRAFR